MTRHTMESRIRNFLQWIWLEWDFIVHRWHLLFLLMLTAQTFG